MPPVDKAPPQLKTEIEIETWKFDADQDATKSVSHPAQIGN
jgi:hypothetical protein